MVQKSARNTRALNRGNQAQKENNTSNLNGQAPGPEGGISTKKRVKFTGTGDDDEEVIMDDEDHTPAPGTGTNNRPMRRSAAQSLKKMKIDEEQTVKDIFERPQQ